MMAASQPRNRIAQMVLEGDRPTVHQQVYAVLVRAHDILSQPGAWCQDVQARRQDGQQTYALDMDAYQWCAYGAVLRAAAEVTGYLSDARSIQPWPPGREGVTSWSHMADTTRLAIRAMMVASCYGAEYSMVQYNDTPGRTQAEVAGLLRAAIDDWTEREGEDSA